MSENNATITKPTPQPISTIELFFIIGGYYKKYKEIQKNYYY